MKDKNKNALAVTPTAQIGKSLIRDAVNDFNEQQKKKIVKQVSDLMERKVLMERMITKSQKRLNLVKDQLQAVHDGEFEIVLEGMAGVPGQRMENGIRFKKEDLNISWSETEKW